MSEKIARLGIERDNDLMYYIKNGDVWATPRKRPGQPKGKAQKVATPGIELDYSRYLYFLDADGDVARQARASGGSRKSTPRKSSSGTPRTGTPRTARAAAPAVPRTATSARDGGASVNGETRDAQLDREIAECLAKSKSSTSGNGGDNGGQHARRGAGRSRGR